MTETSNPAHGTGQVITRFGAELIVETTSGELLRCTTRRKLDQLAAGDYVQWQAQSQGNAAVTQLLPRRNVLERPDFRGRLRAIAANIDLIIVVSSWQPLPNWELIDRYLIAAQRLDADVLLVMNKADLHEAFARESDLACMQEFMRIGYPMVSVSAELQQGMDDIKQAIAGCTAIVVGQSGVGKSSIAAQLLPQADIRIGAIAETGEGRHTTTSAMLYRLPSGGNLIDSPGVRDFGFTDLDFATLEQGFVEFKPWLGECRFNNCTHHHEPGCAIKEAAQQGKLPAERFARYRNLLTTL